MYRNIHFFLYLLCNICYNYFMVGVDIMDKTYSNEDSGTILDNILYNLKSVKKIMRESNLEKKLSLLNSIGKNLSKETIIEIIVDESNINNTIKLIDIYINNSTDLEYILRKSNIKIEENRFSKNNKELITKDNIDNMKLGTKIHYILETTYFINPNYNILEDKYVNYIKAFLDNKLLKNIDKANIYKEYEFIYNKDNEILHGIIDLMLEYNDHIDIIDYKLKHVEDDAYLKQLNGYKEYIINLTNKKTNIYLYSIMDKIIIDLN